MRFFVFKPGCPSYWVELLEYSRRRMTVILKVFKNSLNTLCSMKLYGKSEVLRQDGPTSKCFNMKWRIFHLQWCKFSTGKPWDLILKSHTFSVLHIPPSVCCLRLWGRSSITGELKIFQDSENLHRFMNCTIVGRKSKTFERIRSWGETGESYVLFQYLEESQLCPQIPTHYSFLATQV